MKNNRTAFTQPLLPLLGLLSAFAVAEDVPVQTVRSPVPLVRKNPDYPDQPLRKGQDGWVEINMMIDETGKPFEIAVVNSAGDKLFEKAAINAVKDWKYEPAVFNGMPSVFSVRTILRFQIGESPGARRDFVRAYKLFSEAIKSSSQEEAMTLLDKLVSTEGRNAYELAYLGLARFLYANKYGTSFEQMENLNIALSFSGSKDDPSFLSEQEARLARQQLMKLQIDNQFYQEALNNYRFFEEAADKEIVDAFKPIMEQVRVLKATADQPYEVPLTLDEDGYANINLFKGSTYVADVEGKVAEFHLHCEHKYVSFAVEPEVAYSVPPELGACELFVLGDAGTKLKLGQQ